MWDALPSEGRHEGRDDADALQPAVDGVAQLVAEQKVRGHVAHVAVQQQVPLTQTAPGRDGALLLR